MIDRVMTRSMAPVLAVLLLSMLAIPPAAAAQGGIADTPGHRKWLGAAIGATITMVPALVANYSPSSTARCSSRPCVATVAGVAGGMVGFMIGRERDMVAVRRQAAGPTIQLNSAATWLDLQFPLMVESFDDGAVVIGREGLATVAADGSVQMRGATIRGISSAAGLPARDAVIASTPIGLYAFGLRDDTPDGRQVLRDGGNTLRAVGSDEVVVGGGELLRRLRLSGTGNMVMATEEARAEGVGAVGAMAYSSFAGVLWTLSGSRLVARTATQLQELGSLALPAPGRSLAISGGRALVSAGQHGLFVVDVSRPDDPRLLAHVDRIHFAFDAVLTGDTAYVAAGEDGLLVLDVTDPTEPVTVGVGRRLGYVSSLALTTSGRLYVLDPNGPRLHTLDLVTGLGSR